MRKVPDGYELYACGHPGCDEIIKGLSKLMICRKLPGWTEGILRHRYYYKDPQEIDRILEIGQSFLRLPPSGINLPDLSRLLASLIERFIDHYGSPSFHDLCVFCLQNIQKELVEYTGLLIDEYKQEESYQLLLDGWRQRILHKDTGLRRLHILQDGRLRYFHEEGNELSGSETALYRTHYPDECIDHLPEHWEVTPALVHAPEEIIIYSDQKNQSTIELLLNLFEEKALLKPKSKFPFERC